MENIVRPEISVIIPVYNAEEYLKECLDSILIQTFANFELILVDDGSKDSSLKILEEYKNLDKRIHLIYQKNYGAAIARNKGMQQAKGKYLLFLDADDLFDPEMFQKMYKKIKETDAEVLICRFDVLNTQTLQTEIVDWDLKEKLLPPLAIFSYKDCPSYILNITSTNAWNKLFKREFIQKNNIYFQNISNTNDALFTMKALILAQRITVLPERLIHYRSGNKFSISANREKNWNSSITFLTELKNFLQKNNLYPTLENSFFNLFLTTMLFWGGNQLKEPVRSFSQNHFLSILLNEFGMIFKDRRYFYNPNYFEQVEKIQYQYYDTKKLQRLFEQERDKIIPIVLATNQLYFMYAGVTIQSIIQHKNPDRFYDIYILHTDLTDEMQTSLMDLTNDNLRVKCINIKNKITKDCHFYARSYFSEATFYRLIIPELFYGYDKILYLDCDLVVKTDIAELFDTNIEDYIIGAAKNPIRSRVAEYCIKTLNVLPDNYFNAGVLLINISQWIKNGISQKCYKLLDPNKQFYCPDQDALNIACKGKVFLLSPTWNCLWQVTLPEKEEYLKKDQQWWYEESYQNARILHYTSAIKPWKNPEYRLAHIWWSYARKSPFYEQILYQNIKNLCLIKKQVISPKVIQLASCQQIKEESNLCYPLIVQYVKEAFLNCITFGKSAKKHKNNLLKIHYEMSKKIQSKKEVFYEKK